MTASTIYLGITLLLPWLNALLSGRGGIDTEAAAWTATIPVLAMFSYGLWRLIQSLVEPKCISTKLDTTQSHHQESIQ
jgi:hypothetical protein